jgi:uncharacterized protein (TIGR02680 family)
VNEHWHAASMTKRGSLFPPESSAADAIDWTGMTAAERLLRGGLPVPARTRWQPLRLGLVNLYLFEDEVFPFSGGRLLLRGDNGAGKSRVLALTLPLLLDGQLHATRVEPDRDANRQVAWNLLMDEHKDRAGYTWIEFGRIDEDGHEHFLTLGLGMRGVRDRGITDHWMFVTRHRIGVDLSLVTPERRVVSKRVLAESLGDAGQLFEVASDYRRAVDESLFRLNERYDALLDLLLQLRQPQLAKKLDLVGLEAALREAMPPVSLALLNDAADAFRSLDQERQTLAGLCQSRDTVRDFLKPYRRHVQVGLRRAAARLRIRHSQFEWASKDSRDAEQNLHTAKTEVELAVEALRHLNEQLQMARAALSALQTDPAMKLAERLNTARQLHEAAKEQLTDAEAAMQRAEQAVAEAENEAKRQEGEVGRASEQAARRREEAQREAAPESLARIHAEQFARIMPSQETGIDPNVIEEVEGMLRDRIGHWRRTAELLESLCKEVNEAIERLRIANDRLQAAEAHHQASADRVVADQKVADVARDELWTAIQQWWRSAASAGFPLGDLESLELAWRDWADKVTDESPVIVAADAALRSMQSALADQRSEMQHQQSQLSHERDARNAELGRLRAGEAIQPAAPPTRDPSTRQTRAGAPLWRLIEFVPDVPQSEWAGWEAALEASGLLDAWLEPDGRVTDPRTHDNLLQIDVDPVLAEPRQLARVVLPAPDLSELGFEETVVASLLQRIGVGENAARVWVSASGRWQNGPLSGCWSKPSPQYIGRNVRDAYRARRIDELEAELAGIAAAQSGLEHQLEVLHQRGQSAVQWRDKLPREAELVRAMANLQAAEGQRNEAARSVNDARDKERTVRAERDNKVAVRDTTARDIGLHDWADKPEPLLARLQRYESALSTAIDSHHSAASAIASLARVQQRFDRSRDGRDEQARQLAAVRNTERTRWAAFDELQRSVGGDAQEITTRVSAKEKEVAHLEGNLSEAAQKKENLRVQAGKLEQKLEELKRKIETEDAARREAANELGTLAGLQLLPLSDNELNDVVESPTSLTATIELARRIEKLQWDVPTEDDAWKRSQDSIFNQTEPLKSRLTSFGMKPETEFVGEHLHRVRILHDGALVTPDKLVDRLASEIDEHERVLSEREREILEKHLLGEVAGELHDRMHQAAELVDSMNREVTQRPMRTGMQMRFRWELDREGAAGLPAACEVLRSGAATRSDQDRLELGNFLQSQIRVAREQDQAGSWREQLAAALDYRHWHRLRIDRRAGPDQDWKPLTRRSYGSGSGGEKAIALTMPQVAAAAAYYRTADPNAPRLILMDEVFAGISPNNRAACMELLAAFDLDVVMTSEHEWGCYETVPELAICQLTRMPDLAAIDNTLFIWNGHERRESSFS